MQKGYSKYLLYVTLVAAGVFVGRNSLLVYKSFSSSVKTSTECESGNDSVSVLTSNEPHSIGIQWYIPYDSKEEIRVDSRFSAGSRKTPYDKICKVRVTYKNNIDVPVYHKDGTVETVKNTFDDTKTTIESTGVLVGDGVILLSGHSTGLSVNENGIAYGSDSATSDSIFDYKYTYDLKTSDIEKITLSFAEIEYSDSEFSPLAKVVLLGEDVFDKVIYKNPKYTNIINEQRKLKADGTDTNEIEKVDIVMQDYSIINLNNTEVTTLDMQDETTIDSDKSQAVVLLASGDDLYGTSYTELTSLSDLGWFGFYTSGTTDKITLSKDYYLSGYPNTIEKQKGYFLSYDETVDKYINEYTDHNLEIGTSVKFTGRVYEDYCRYPYKDIDPYFSNAIIGDATVGQSGGPLWNYGNGHRPYLAGIIGGFESRTSTNDSEYGLNYITPIYMGNNLMETLESMGCTGEPKVYIKEVIDSRLYLYPYSTILPAIYPSSSYDEDEKPIRNCVVIGDGVCIIEDDCDEDEYNVYNANSFVESTSKYNDGYRTLETKTIKTAIPNSSLAVLVDRTGSKEISRNAGMLPIMTEFEDDTEALIIQAVTSEDYDYARTDKDSLITMLGKHRAVRGKIAEGNVHFNEDDVDFEVGDGDVVLTFKFNEETNQNEVYFAGFVTDTSSGKNKITGELVKIAKFTKLRDEQLEETRNILREMYPELTEKSDYTYITDEPVRPKYVVYNDGYMMRDFEEYDFSISE